MRVLPRRTKEEMTERRRSFSIGGLSGALCVASGLTLWRDYMGPEGCTQYPQEYWADATITTPIAIIGLACALFLLVWSEIRP